MNVNNVGSTIHHQTLVNPVAQQLSRMMNSLRDELAQSKAAVAFRDEQLQTALQGLQNIMAGGNSSAVELRQMAMQALQTISQACQAEADKAEQNAGQTPQTPDDPSPMPRDRCR